MNLVQQDVPMPKPGAGELCVKVHAVPLNARDQLLVAGTLGAAGADFIPISGGPDEVDALGPDVDGW
ncbi:hypothetical protein [Sphingomonas sp.]|uniref:hypothetical protein n=1 Tax=Sphingomonas sp. TaxID=28214 RepID=UPI003AFF74FA